MKPWGVVPTTLRALLRASKFFVSEITISTTISGNQYEIKPKSLLYFGIGVGDLFSLYYNCYNFIITVRRGTRMAFYDAL